MNDFLVFKGNCPKNVNKDAKYAVRTVGGSPVIALRYLSADGEEWLATTESHPELVKMVNAVKISMGEAPNGLLHQRVRPGHRSGRRRHLPVTMARPFDSSLRERRSQARAST